MRKYRLLVGSVLSFGWFALAASAQDSKNWAQWRGPSFNGSSTAKNLPDVILKDSAVWSTEIPGHSNGTPIVWGDRVFVTSQTKAGKLVAYCLSKADGKILWQKDVAEGTQAKGANDLATPSPVTDGKKVIFLFGSGDLEAFDFDGKSLWKRNLQKDHGRWNYQWLYGASPLLYRGKLYVPVLHRDVHESNWSGGPKPGETPAESYLLCINPEDGKELWKHVRPTDAKVEAKEAYGTPIPFERPAGNQILLAGGDVVTGHDPETGKEIWRAGGWNPEQINHHRLVASPVTHEGLIIVCPPKKGDVLAFKEGGQGEVTKTHRAWKSTKLTSDAAVPLIYNNLMYVLDGDAKQLICVDPKTGEKKWGGTLDSNKVFRTSPTGADGKIYVMNESGDLYVLATNEFKVLSKVALGGDGSRGSVAAVDGLILVRTGDKVWAFTKK